MTLAAAEVKSCCAAAYGSEAARFLLGERFHPGGAALTSELVAALRVGPGDLVADVACGPGASALQAARETGCSVVGIDLAPPQDAPADPRVRFRAGDAEALPLADGSVDGVLSECALCTFPDKAAAAAEVARVLRPGRRLALSDVVAERERLPEELHGLAARVACIADARPLQEVAGLLERAGLEIERAEPVEGALERLVDRVEARLRLARTVAPGLLDGNVERGLELVAHVRAAVEAGVLGYGLVVARKP